jgi:hypothetical protein
MKTTCAVVVALVLSAAGALADRGESQVQQPACVAFSSGGPVTAGNSFGTPIGHGLEFRLSKEWFISVGPVGEPNTDYLSIVSPPFRTAPHLVIGHGYGLTASESVGLERPLRFVLNAAEHAAARKAIESEPAETLLRTLDGLARGVIKFRIYSYQIRRTLPDGTPTDVMESISFQGEACVTSKGETLQWR